MIILHLPFAGWGYTNSSGFYKTNSTFHSWIFCVSVKSSQLTGNPVDAKIIPLSTTLCIIRSFVLLYLSVNVYMYVCLLLQLSSCTYLMLFCGQYTDWLFIWFVVFIFICFFVYIFLLTLHVVAVVIWLVVFVS